MEIIDAREDLLLAAAQVRLLADLLLPYTDLEDVDRASFARVLQDLSLRLERDLNALEAHMEQLHGVKEERS